MQYHSALYLKYRFLAILSIWHDWNGLIKLFLLVLHTWMYLTQLKRNSTTLYVVLNVQGG